MMLEDVMLRDEGLLLDIERHAKILEKKDYYKLLSANIDGEVWDTYLYTLASVYAIAGHQGIDASKSTLFEFGAHQSAIRQAVSSIPYNPLIAHFFALLDGHNDYLAFDPSYSKEGFAHTIKYTKELFADPDNKRSLPRSAYKPYLAIDLDLLEENVNKISIDYITAEKRIYEEYGAGRIPVIFSNHVLNSPELRKECPFWNLPGFHVHFAACCEIENRISKNEDLRTSEKHLGAFKSFFDISMDNDIQMNYLPRIETSVYVWNAK